jgi:excisionase family DNA binding protein
MTDHTTPTPENDPWLTVQQVSEELKLKPTTVRAWVKTGRLAAARVGRTWRIRRSEVDRAMRLNASPAYLRQAATSSSPPRTAAPRQIADHITAFTPSPGQQP